MTLWFASGNINKKKELAAILNAGGGDHNILTPAEMGIEFDPKETGATFYENALLKARELYALLEQHPLQKQGALLLQGRPPLFTPGDPIIADDSGICVDALDGRPGIYSARYAGPSGAPARQKLESHERNALLLQELGDNPLRTARFVCAMTLFFTPDRFFIAQETLEGEIVKDQQAARGTGGGRGTRGFGYDPILYIPSLDRTVAELSDDEKNAISHRAKAGRIIAAILEACI